MSSRARRPLTLVRALKAGRWDAANMSYQLDEDLLPECPFPGASARYVWENLRELQLVYQDRNTGWQTIPAQFELLARALPTVVALEPIPTQPDRFERRPMAALSVPHRTVRPFVSKVVSGTEVEALTAPRSARLGAA